MKYEKINLFGKQRSRGTFDDFFNTEKYDSLQEAYESKDYVECDFVKDEGGALHIEAKNISKPDVKKYHRLNYQSPVSGLDVSDDNAGCEIAFSLF